MRTNQEAAIYEDSATMSRVALWKNVRYTIRPSSCIIRFLTQIPISECRNLLLLDISCI
jgi:hypothetical protein